MAFKCHRERFFPGWCSAVPASRPRTSAADSLARLVQPARVQEEAGAAILDGMNAIVLAPTADPTNPPNPLFA